jgi:hypothetical protein
MLESVNSNNNNNNNNNNITMRHTDFSIKEERLGKKLIVSHLFKKFSEFHGKR